jgi:hypothetical protein
MTSTNRPQDVTGAHDALSPDALFDQIERELAALTHAPLDAVADPAPQVCVDEFSDDFLNWSMPPPHQARARHSVR